MYTVDSLDHLRADRDADSRGLQIIGVFHSHTHTDAYPSLTDVGSAVDQGWHYVLVSLRDEARVVRSDLLGADLDQARGAEGHLDHLAGFRIVGGTIAEEPVELA